jgi:hypothetical protein
MESDYRVRKSLQLIPVLSQMNPFHTLRHYTFNNPITLPSMPRSSKWSLPSSFPRRNFVRISLLSHAPSISCQFLLDFLYRWKNWNKNLLYMFLLHFSAWTCYTVELNCTIILDGDVGRTADVTQYHPHIHAAASWFRKLENASTLRSEWLMLLFNCSPCCPSNYLTTIASTFRAKVRSITNSIPCCNWPTHFTKDPPLLPGSLLSPEYPLQYPSFISCRFEHVASLYKLYFIVSLLSTALCYGEWIRFEPLSNFISFLYSIYSTF